MPRAPRATVVALTWSVVLSVGCAGDSPPEEPLVTAGDPGAGTSFRCTCGLNAAACRPDLFGDNLVDEAGWEILGFSPDHLDADRVGHMQRGESLVLTFDDDDDRPLTNQVDGISWLSTNPGVAAITPEGPLTARLEAIGPGRAEPDPTRYIQGPVVAAVSFSDGSCGGYSMKACEHYTGATGRLILRCTFLTALVVE